MQLASRNPCCKAFWATPFKIGFDFRPVLDRPFAEITLSADPGHLQGAPKEQQAPGALVFGCRKPHFWKLGCIWSLFLETSQSKVGQYERQVRGCASRPWYLAVAKPHLRKLLPIKGKVNAQYHSPAGPRAPGRQEVVALNKLLCIK